MALTSGMSIGTQARALAAALLLGTAILSFVGGQTAYAARSASSEPGDTATTGDSNTGDGAGGGPVYLSRTQDDLIKAGYTCTRLTDGLYECTKPGATTYWCDLSGACEQKPRHNPQDDNRPPRGGGVLNNKP